MTELKRALAISGLTALGYLALVIVVVFVEVACEIPDLSVWLFYGLTGLYGLSATWLHLRHIPSRPLAVCSAIAITVLAFFLAIVVGVNVKFLIGGSL